MSPLEIFHAMYDNDPFSQLLGMELMDIGAGRCTLRMTVRPEHLNGFKVAHGGVSFCLADSCFAFASNSRGQHAVSIETSISHLAPVFEGDVLTAIAKEQYLGRSTAIYEIDILNQNAKRVALFKGTVFRKKTMWDIDKW